MGSSAVPNVGRLECGELSALEAIDTLLAEELSVRASRRVRTALSMARLTPTKTLAGFDFTFQPSLDRERILALAELGFVDRREAVHFAFEVDAVPSVATHGPSPESARPSWVKTTSHPVRPKGGTPLLRG